MKLTCEGTSERANLQEALDAASDAAGRIIVDQTGVTDQPVEWTLIHVHGLWAPLTERSLTTRIEFVIPPRPAVEETGSGADYALNKA